jgi:hypothetical protein
MALVGLVLLPVEAVTPSLMFQRGTLIAVAPSKEGIVIAADSRSTIDGLYCDQTYKLIEVAGSNPTVVSVPGIGIVYSRPPEGTRDLCAWIKTGPRVMDVEHFAKEWMGRNPGSLTQAMLQRLGLESLEQMRGLVRHSPDAPKAYAGNNFYAIVVTRYDRQADVRYLGVVGARFNPATNLPEVTDHVVWKFTKQSRGEAFNFGLFDYVPAHVLREGRQFALKYLAFNPGRRIVSEIPSYEAASALENLLDAASRTTQIVATPGGVGIGGATDVVLLTDADKPQRLKWKP